MVESVPRTVRERARAELTREIIETARRHLATGGAAALSLRAVARDLGMASSAIYRYMPSRDELLTTLIIEAYQSLGTTAAQHEATVPRDDFRGRWLAACQAVRAWALARPHEYALIYGSPVPGYEAPQDTIAPASLVGVVMISIVVDAAAAGAIDPATLGKLSDDLQAAIGPIRGFVPPDLPDELVVRALIAWTHIFGAISFELFGHRHNVVASDESARATFFNEEARRLGVLVGLCD